MKWLIMAILCGVFFAPHANAAACTKNDFAVTNLRWQNMPDVESIRVTGSVVNNGASPAYATVQLIYLDGADKIVDSSGELWLAGMIDIPPKSPRQFIWSQHFIGEAAKIEAKIIQVRYSSK
jgi:hypothetical protein